MTHTKVGFRQQQSPVVTVVDGVKFTDGDFIVTNYANAAACIQAALDSIKTLGGTVYIRSGTYLMGGFVSFAGTTAPVTVMGDGMAKSPAGLGTILQQTTNANVFHLDTLIEGIEIRDLTLVGDYDADLVFGLDVRECVIDGVFFQSNHASTTNLTNMMVMQGVTGIRYLEVKNCVFNENFAGGPIATKGTAVAFVVDGFGSDISVHDNLVYASFGGGIIQRGIACQDISNTVMGDNISIHNNTIRMATYAGVGSYAVNILGEYQNLKITNNQIESYIGTSALSAVGIYLSLGHRSGSAISLYGDISENTVVGSSVEPLASVYGVQIAGVSVTNPTQFCRVSRNLVRQNQGVSVYLQNIKNVSISDNQFISLDNYGLQTDHLSYFTMSGNFVSSFGNDAAHMDTPSYGTISGNFLKTTGVGSFFALNDISSIHMSIAGNTCISTYRAIFTSGSYGMIGPNQNEPETNIPSADQTNSFNVNKQIVKAYGNLSTGVAGAVSFDGYNIISASYSGTTLTINFDRDMVGSNYTPIVVKSNLVNPAYTVVITAIAAGSIHVGQMNSSGVLQNWITSQQLMVAVLGESA